MDAFDEFRQLMEGQSCLDLMAQEFWYRGELAAPITVLFWQFDTDRWTRFGIDAGDFHWREVAAVERIQNEGPDFDDPLRSLATEFPVVDHRIQHVSLTRLAPLHVIVQFQFDRGPALELVDLNERLELRFRAGAV